MDFYINVILFSWDVEIEATRAIIKKINQMEPKPKFFIVCGDIVDAFDCKKYKKKVIKFFFFFDYSRRTISIKTRK